jgi:hypothetical protein
MTGEAQREPIGEYENGFIAPASDHDVAAVDLAEILHGSGERYQISTKAIRRESGATHATLPRSPRDAMVRELPNAPREALEERDLLDAVPGAMRTGAFRPAQLYRQWVA